MRQKYKGRDKRGYKNWIDAMWLAGFTYPISNIQEKYGLSLSYIQHNILTKIPYVVYDFRFSYGPRRLKKSKTCVRQEDLSNLLKKGSKYSRQTEFIDLYSYLYPYKKVARTALKMAQNNRSRTGLKMRKGMLSEEILKYINSSLSLNYKIKNYPCYKRTAIPWKECEDIDLLELKNKDFYRYDGEKSSEEFYRRAFINGDIKVKIGNKITIFIRNKQNIKEMKIPYLIPYNYKIRVIGKRNYNKSVKNFINKK